jgi:hypothetical protein
VLKALLEMHCLRLMIRYHSNVQLRSSIPHVQAATHYQGGTPHESTFPNILSKQTLTIELLESTRRRVMTQ